MRIKHPNLNNFHSIFRLAEVEPQITRLQLQPSVLITQALTLVDPMGVSNYEAAHEQQESASGLRPSIPDALAAAEHPSLYSRRRLQDVLLVGAFPLV